MLPKPLRIHADAWARTSVGNNSAAKADRTGATPMPKKAALRRNGRITHGSLTWNVTMAQKTAATT